MHNLPRVLVGTLFCGENEFGLLKQSLHKQTYLHWDHFVLENLPNKEAHDRLYRTFMERSDDFDLFLKLDADMVFQSPESLRILVELFESEPELDHAILAVHDWASDMLIMGLHAYSNRAIWKTSDEELFVDYSPSVPGKRLSTKEPPAPIVIHSPDPSPFQAFQFGVHRALKVVQRDRSDLALFRSRMQWRLLENVWRRFLETNIRRLGLTVLGAEKVIRGEVEQAEYDANSDDLHNRFQEEFSGITTEELKRRLDGRWNSRRQRESIYLRNVGVKRLVRSACVEIPKRMAASVCHRLSSKYV